MEKVWLMAAAIMLVGVAAGLAAPRLGLPSAVIEVVLGIVLGNITGMSIGAEIGFLAVLGSCLLTFLAGAEIDPASLRMQLLPGVCIGLASFFVPFASLMLIIHYIIGWDWRIAQLAAIALSTTSVAIVYSLTVFTGINKTGFGKMMLTAVFVTDFVSVVMLGILFSHFNSWLPLFLLAAILVVILMPGISERLLGGPYSDSIDTGVRFFILVIIFLSGMAVLARMEAVLPAYVSGVAAAKVFSRHEKLAVMFRGIAFQFFTPFFFISSGALVSLNNAVSGIFISLLLFSTQLSFKCIGTWMTARFFGFSNRLSVYLSLIMASGLTFGIIAAQFGLKNGIIDQGAYSILMTVIMTSAVIPAIIAQRLHITSKECMDNSLDG